MEGRRVILQSLGMKQHFLAANGKRGNQWQEKVTNRTLKYVPLLDFIKQHYVIILTLCWHQGNCICTAMLCVLPPMPFKTPQG